MGEYKGLTSKVIKLLTSNSGQSVKYLAKKLGIDETFFASYLKTLEQEGYVKSKRIGLPKFILR
jgi:DNA-binding IclR family transcriptional regulator